MPIIMQGNVFGTPKPLSLSAKNRFIAFIDILGMKAWVNQDDPVQICQQIHYCLSEILKQAPNGEINGEKIGPLFGWFLFSDCLFLYTPDGSWASLHVLVSTSRMIVQRALSIGIPMRGAVALGKMVVDKNNSLIVGQPLVEAYEAESQKGYRGMGVQITSKTVTTITGMLESAEVPKAFSHEYTTALFRERDTILSPDFIWFEDTLLINHWSAEYTAGVSLEPHISERIDKFTNDFNKRGLPISTKILAQSRDLLRFVNENSSIVVVSFSHEGYFDSMQSELFRINEIGID
ncbi:MAG: hypothetical protein P9M14_10245 [Candidatus Alcyoniella australis]|nr:hypothetical protein [Candidatus Alcyoniella australis]